LKDNYIYLSAEGTATVDYEIARLMLEREDLLTAVQEEYARQLPEGERPEFAIQRKAPGVYHFVNGKGQGSDVRELVRRHDRDQATELVLYVCGRRCFGAFRALTRIRVAAGPDRISTYDVEVYAYPDNRVVRFFARRLSVVERCFREETDSMIQLITSICHGLVDEPGLEAQVALDTLDRPLDVIPVTEGAQSEETLAAGAETGSGRSYHVTFAQ
jgi:hypothetical protein